MTNTQTNRLLEYKTQYLSYCSDMQELGNDPMDFDTWICNENTEDVTHPDSIIGKKARIKEENDNENYDKFRGKILIITHAERSGLGYDNAVFPDLLCSFKLRNGHEVPFSLYEYEFDIL